jgi:hypothetical protein
VIAPADRLFGITVLAVSGVLALWGVLDWHDRQAAPWLAWFRVLLLGVLAAAVGAACSNRPATC